MEQESDADADAVDSAASPLHASPDAAPANDLGTALSEAVASPATEHEALHTAPATDNLLLTRPEPAPAFEIAAPAPQSDGVTAAEADAGRETQAADSYPLAGVFMLAAIILGVAIAAGFVLARRRRRVHTTLADPEIENPVAKSGRVSGEADPAAAAPAPDV